MSQTLDAVLSKGQAMPEKNRFPAVLQPIPTTQVTPALTGNPYGDHESREGLLVAHSLCSEGFDASEDGTGRGTPLIPTYSVCLGSDPIWNRDLAMPMTRRNGDPGVVAFSCKDSGADAGEISPTLRAMGHSGSHANAGGQVAVAIPSGEPFTLAIRGRGDSHHLEYRQDGVANALLTPNGGRAGIGVGAVAFAQNTRDEVRMIGGDGSITGALAAQPGMKQQSYLATAMAVRRITPEEAEKLQGFPVGYTAIPFRGKVAADGNRYKALGNSMAVPVMAWISRRIELALEKSA